MSEKVLITGAGGYIGHHVVKKFLDKGYEVIVNDFIYDGVDERATRTDVDIFSNDEDLFDKLGRPNILVHLAWRDGFVHNSKAHMEDLSNHIKFLQYMIDKGTEYISIMGSMHEIGYWEGMVNETTPCNPLSMYGIAKNALRQAMLLYCEEMGVKLHWLRAYYIYGDAMRGSSIFSKIAQACKEGKTVFPFTSGTNCYDFIHIDDLAEQIFQATVQSEYTGIINVCSGKAIPLREKVEKFIEENHYDIRLEYGKYPDRKYDSKEIWGDDTLIKKIMDKCN